MQRLRVVIFAVWLAVLAVIVVVTGQANLALAQGTIIYVSSAGTNQSTCGATPAQACRTIKYAVEMVAQPGDQIQVAAGVYTESVVVNNALSLYGAGAYQTIIDGEGVRGPLLSLGPGLTSTTVISGLTVQNGTGGTNGGGLSLMDSSPLLQAIVVQSNTAQAGIGGGIHLAGASNPLMRGSIACGNSSVQLDNAGSETVDASGNWWGTNTPQFGSAFTGTVAVSPAMSLTLTVQPEGSITFPGGTSILPSTSTGHLIVSLLGGGYHAPAGTPVQIVATNATFDNSSDTVSLSLIDGVATTAFTPTGTLAVDLAAYHPCQPTQAVVSTTITILDLNYYLYFPVIMRQLAVCPQTSVNQYSLIPTIPPQIDHPDYLHGDLNLTQRGYNAVPGVPLQLIDYAGATDPLAPQLPGLFSDNRTPLFSSAYQVNSWDWACSTHGCAGPPLADWDTTLLGLSTTQGESLHLPTRSPNIYSDGQQSYKALVLYAEEERITINFTRDDSVAHGYSVQLEDICVDPNLLALYRAQVGTDGLRSTTVLPGLTAGQVIGVAKDSEILVAMRDRGNFMDPRSRKDWWMGRVARVLKRLDIEHNVGVPQDK